MSDDNNNARRPGNAPRGSRRNQVPENSPAGRPKRGSTSAAPRKYMSQQQREKMYQRWLYIGLAVAAGLIVLSLGVGAFWQYQILPNQVLAEVNGEKITRSDYWKYQDIQLYNQARMFENMAIQFTGQEQSTYLTYAAQLDASRKDIEGSTDVSDATLAQMIEDKLYVQAAEERGIDMSNPVLMQTALNVYAPTTSPLVTPVPSPTMIPQRAEWATATADAQATMQAEQAALLGTPAVSPSASGTPGATPVSGTPVSGTPVASPVASGTPGATPVSGTPVATPDMAVVQANAESDYQTFLNDVLKDTGLSEQEYLDLFAKPQVARAQINAEIANSVSQTGPQVEVSHIQVSTEENANKIYSEIESGAITFENAAARSSIEQQTGANGGQLGWITDLELPEELTTAAFSMEPGTISKPIQSPYGWHILKVTGKEENRALTNTQYQLALTKAQNDFLVQQREANDISSDHYEPTETPTATAFAVPADAPTVVVATPVAGPDLSATPVSGPSINTGTPQASPVASPEASPAATPSEATPEE